MSNQEFTYPLPLPKNALAKKQYRRSSNKPRGLIYKNEFLGGSLFKGRASLRRDYFNVWHFSRRLT